MWRRGCEGDGGLAGLASIPGATGAVVREAGGKNPNKTIVLIDGARLARLMVQYGIGVRDRASATFVLKRIDEDYFEE